MTDQVGERGRVELPAEDPPRYEIAETFRIYNRRLAWMLVAQTVLIVALLELLGQ